jgi:hypothetical protein
MKRRPFERPVDHYDKRLFQIDEKICALLKQRKDLSNSNPGFPPDDSISNWATKYELYEEYLQTLFGTMRMENFFKTRIEPTGFRKHIPVLKTIEMDEQMYTVTVIRQYENASVIQLHVDSEDINDSPTDLLHKRHHHTFELFLGEKYDCRTDRAGGSTGHFTYNFIVSPPLPDHISGLDLVFKEYNDHFQEDPTGLEIFMHLE